MVRSYFQHGVVTVSHHLVGPMLHEVLRALCLGSSTTREHRNKTAH